MNASTFKDYVIDQLGGTEAVMCRPMFGGFGLYKRTVFFAIVYDGELFFKTDKHTRENYISCGMGPFRPNSKQTLKTYYRVPEDVLDDRDSLEEWALDAARLAG